MAVMFSSYIRDWYMEDDMQVRLLESVEPLV